MRKLLALAALGLLVAPAVAQDVPATPAAADYTKAESWLCWPGRQDSCAMPLETTALETTGYGTAEPMIRAANPPIDCFYVYPTVSRDSALNSDLNAGPEEQLAAAVQFARFASLCRPFAPVYRQGTIRSIAAVFMGQDPAPIFDLAYGDVLAAWRHYLANDNRGRPVVLIGHSQGTIHLIKLIQEEIEGKPEAARMLSAILLGFNVEVPTGQATGGTFRTTPLCTRAGQTGCVITYVSFRAGSPPPAGALFGRAAGEGMTVACTNPAALGSDAAAPLDSYWFTASTAPATNPIAWSSQGTPPTPFLHTRGLVSGACTHDGPLGYLAVTVNADPADARTDRIPGDVAIAGAPQPGWGIHLVDMSLTQGDLLRAVQAQIEARAHQRH